MPRPRCVERFAGPFRMLGLGVASAALWFAAQSALAEAPKSLTRPHVLFIAIDDLNDWVEPLGGHPLAKTPHLQKLAERGTTFLNAHCNAPLCNPSRTSLLTGLRPSTTGVYGLEPWFRTAPAWKDRVSLPQYFQAHGYRTLTAGKIYHGDYGRPGGFRIQLDRKNNPIIRIPAKPEFQTYGPIATVGPRPEKKLVGVTPAGNNPLVDWGVFPHKDADKGDSLTADWAVQRIADAAKHPDAPFFLAVGFVLPHVPCYATQPWFDKYPDNDTVLPLIRENDRDDTPRFSQYLHWSLPEPRLPWLRKHQQWRNLVRSYLACTSFVDAQVGRLLNSLHAAGLEDKTVIILWSDHGWHLGEKGITGKNSLWERSTRVPLIIAGPGVLAGARCIQPAELLDIHPTLIDLCRLPPRNDLEGLSLLPQLRDPRTPRPRPAITTHNQGNHAIRSVRWRYIRYADGSEELYDMLNDPQEFTNLAARPEYAAILRDHKAWLPKIDRPPIPGSAQRILTYDKSSDTAVWENTLIRRNDPVP